MQRERGMNRWVDGWRDGWWRRRGVRERERKIDIFTFSDKQETLTWRGFANVFLDRFLAFEMDLFKQPYWAMWLFFAHLVWEIILMSLLMSRWNKSLLFSEIFSCLLVFGLLLWWELNWKNWKPLCMEGPWQYLKMCISFLLAVED